MIGRHVGFLIVALGGLTLCLSLFGGPAAAQDTERYFELLEAGKITPLGAIRAGNEAGTIPEWNCDADHTPPHIDVPEAARGRAFTGEEPFQNPFADEEPRFVITADNYEQYEDKLSPGQIKMFKQYPERFEMPVYPTHRTACYEPQIYEWAKINAREAKVVNNGGGQLGGFGATAFPLPENGLELIWGHIHNQRPWRAHGFYTSVTVYSDGSKVWGMQEIDVQSPYNDPQGHVNNPKHGREGFYGEDPPYIQSHSLSEDHRPERVKGEITYTRGFMQKIKNRRQTWQYLPGTRRVRRFPFFGYDIPLGAGGLSGVDDARLFNGSAERFEWKMVTEEPVEMFVPYNGYAVDSDDLSYEELLGEVHINPEHMRWELHRVYILEGTLKEDYRHWYSKRVLYIDDDSKKAVMSDNYDQRGDLWRFGLQTLVWGPKMNGFRSRAQVFHDFNARAYQVRRLINEAPPENKPKINHGRHDLGYFSPANLRILGRR